MPRLHRYLFLVVALLVISTTTQARSLYWEDMRVQAQLRADGSLHVIERQHYVFNGNWNGGERKFNIGWGEHLDFLRLSRIDSATQRRINLSEGDLSRIDQYQFSPDNSSILRWRSRLPQDRLFNNQHIIYELEYVYTGILHFKNYRYFLNHNFAFRDRPGEFRHYQLDLKIDPIWKVQTSTFTPSVEETNLLPGMGVVLRAELDYLGSGSPANVATPVPMPWRLALLSALAAFILTYLVAWLRHESGRGRFEPLVPTEDINEEWLMAHVFNELPEEVGSLWDLQTGPAEVSAMLARLTLEGKLKSHIEVKGFWIFKKPVLHLELLVNRDELTRNERSLINKLFPRGMKTDTDLIREHYRSRGFDPASYLRSRMKGNKLKSKYTSRRWSSRRFTVISYSLAALSAITAFVMTGFSNIAFVMPAVLIATLGIVFFIFKTYGLLIEVERPRWVLFKVLFFYLLLAAAVTTFIISGFASPSIWIVLMYILILMGLFAYIMDLSRTTIKVEEVKLRKLLCAARRYFQQELKKPVPDLQDAWYPYLIAFGLDASIQKWFRAFAGRTQGDDVSGFTSISASSWSTPAGQSGWTGGGGSFGGAGATGAWTAAAASMSAGFSAPSSGSSGGGFSSGGGGGSSGGGGGGGW